MVVRRLPLVAITMLSLGATGFAQTRDLTKAELAKVQVAEGHVTNEWFSEPDRYSAHWQVIFRNDGGLEIAEIEMRPYVSINGRKVFQGAPIKLSRFANAAFPHNGSLLPFGISDPVPSILTTFPRTLVAGRSTFGIDIVGAKTFTKEANLHDYGHLFTRMRGLTDDQCVALFKKDPSLLVQPRQSRILPEYLAYAAGGPKTIAYVLANAKASPTKAKISPQQIKLDYLQCACLNPRTDVLEMALKATGLDIKKWPAMAWSPVERTIMQRNRAGWLYLLKKGASPRYERSDHMSLAQVAIQTQSLEALKDLIRFGAKPTDHDSLGFGWMHYAVTRYEMIPAIHALGAPVNDLNTRDKRTPFHMAFMDRKMEAAIALLKLGADPTIKTTQGKNVYDYERMARERGLIPYLNEIVRKYGKFKKK